MTGSAAKARARKPPAATTLRVPLGYGMVNASPGPVLGSGKPTSPISQVLFWMRRTT